MIFASSMMMRAVENGEPWTPLSITGCKLWLDSDLGITLDGSDNVSDWADQSGTSNHVSQSVAADRPDYETNYVNGHASVESLGSGDHLDKITGVSGIGGATELTVCAVFNPSSGTQEWCNIAWGTSFFLQLHNKNGQYHTYYELNDTYYARAPFTNYNAWNIFICWWDQDGGAGDSDKIKIYHNGTLVSNNYSGSNPSSLVATPDICVLGYINGSASMTGHLAHLTVYAHAFTTEERNSMTSYLSNRYNISVS